MQSPVPSAGAFPAVFTLWFPGAWIANCRVSSMNIISNYYLFINTFYYIYNAKNRKNF